MKNKKYHICTVGLIDNTRDFVECVADKEKWQKCFRDTYKPKTKVVLNMVDLLNQVIAEYKKDNIEETFIGIQLLSGSLTLELQNRCKKTETQRSGLNMCQHIYWEYDKKASDYLTHKNELETLAGIKADLVALTENWLHYMALAIIEYAQKDYM